MEFVEPPEEFDIGVDPGSRTALHLAIAHSHPDVVDVLLNHKGTYIHTYMKANKDTTIRTCNLRRHEIGAVSLQFAHKLFKSVWTKTEGDMMKGLM